MSGLTLILIIVLWVIAVKKLTIFLTKSMPTSGFTRLAKVLLFALLLVLPLADEIIGGFQFRALCEQGYAPAYDEAKAKGKTVYLKNIPDRSVQNTIIPIREKSWKYVDYVTKETILSWKEYHARGGWLSRFIGFPQGSPPYTFNGVCSIHSNFPILRNLNMHEVGDK